MESLAPARRRALRAKAHHLHPVVSIGHHGLTPAVLHELDVNLLAHELIKVRVFSDLRDERDAMLQAHLRTRSTPRRFSTSASCWSCGGRRPRSQQ